MYARLDRDKGTEQKRFRRQKAKFWGLCVKLTSVFTANVKRIMFVNCHLSDMMIYIAKFKLLSSFVQFLRESKSSLLRLESRRNDSVVVRTSLKSSFEDNNGVEKELAVTSVCCTIIPIKIKQNNVFFCKHRLYTESCEKTRHSLATFYVEAWNVWCWNDWAQWHHWELQPKPVFSTFWLKGAKPVLQLKCWLSRLSVSFTLVVRESHCKYFNTSQLTCFALLHNEICYTKY